MKHSSYSFPCVFIFFFILQSSATNSSILLRTCKDAANGDPDNIQYDFCVSCIGQNPKSENATLYDLYRIAMGQAVANATKINKRISNQLTKHSRRLSPHAKKSLQTCAKLYSGASSNLKEAIVAFRDKDSFGANVHISAAMDAARTCEDSFKEEGEKSTLLGEDNMFFEVCAITLAFLTMYSQ